MNKDYPLYKVKAIKNLKELFDYTGKKYANEKAAIYRDGKKNIEKTFAEVNEDIKALAAYFIKKKYSRKHIAVMGENSYHYLITFLATTNSNNVIVPLDKELTYDELKYLFKKGSCDVLVISEAYKKLVLKFKKDFPNIKEIIYIGEGKNSITTKIKEGSEFLAKNSKIYENTKLNNDATCGILFTSGTTGEPKGVMLSHANIASDVVNTAKAVTPNGKGLLILPFHHSFAIIYTNIVLLHGDAMVFCNGLKDFARDMNEFKPQNVALVPLIIEGIYSKVMTAAKQKKKDKMLKLLMFLSSILYNFKIDVRRKLFKSILDNFGGELDLVISGAAPLDPKLIKKFRSLGIEIRQGYGITECSPVLAVCRNNHYNDLSVGKILPNTKIKIDNPDKDGYGEILAKGEIVMKGYYQDDAATKEVMKNGWFATGDIGKIDDQGFIFLKGRKKNLIILSNGENVSPEELEILLGRSKLVAEVIVKAELNKKKQLITAHIFPNEEYIRENKIKNVKEEIDKEIEKINNTIASFKNINKVVIVDKEFPKTTTKKIKR